jgi:hypothetical protein
MSELELSKVASGCCHPISHGERTPARFPQPGELVLLNLVDVRSDSTAASGVTLTRNSTTCTISPSEKNIKPRPCIVSHVHQDSVQNGWCLRVLVVRSYSYKPDPAEFVLNMGGDRHLPLPPPPSCSPLSTPTAFGRPVEIPVSLRKYSWIVARTRTFDMGDNGCVRFVPRSNLMEHS